MHLNAGGCRENLATNLATRFLVSAHFYPFLHAFLPRFLQKKEPKIGRFLALFFKANVNIVKSYLRYNLTLRVLFKVYISSLISANRRI